MEEVCQVLQLGEHLATFQREQLTFSDLLLVNEEDLASLGLQMGPRKRLLTYLRDLEIRRAKLKQVRDVGLGFRNTSDCRFGWLLFRRIFDTYSFSLSLCVVPLFVNNFFLLNS